MTRGSLAFLGFCSFACSNMDVPDSLDLNAETVNQDFTVRGMVRRQTDAKTTNPVRYFKMTLTKTTTPAEASQTSLSYTDTKGMFYLTTFSGQLPSRRVD